MLHQFARSAVWATSHALTAAMLFATAIVLRASWGPITLPSLAQEIEAEVNAELGDWRVEFGAVGVDLIGSAAGIPISFSDVELFDENGDRVVSAPRALIVFDRAVTRGGDLRITRIELTGVEALAKRTAQGEVLLSVRSPAWPEGLTRTAAHRDTDEVLVEAAPAPKTEDIASTELVDILSGEGRPPLLADLREIRLHRSSLRFDDVIAGRLWVLEDVEGALSREGDAYAVSVAGGVRRGAEGVAIPLALQAALPKGSTTAQIEVSSPGVDIDTLVAVEPSLAPLTPLEGALSAKAALTVDMSNGAISPISGALRLDEGAFRIGESEAAPIEQFETRFLLDPAGETLRLSGLIWRSDALALDGGAEVDIQRDAAGAPAFIGVRLLDLAGRIDAPTHFVEPLDFQNGAADFSFSVGDEGAQARSFALQLGGVDISGMAAARFAESFEQSDLRLDVTLGPFDVADLARLWPLQASASGRAWVVENIEAAEVVEAKLSYRSGGASGDEALEMNFKFEGGRARFMPGMPPITKAAGLGVVGLDRVDIELTEGQVAMEGRGPMRIAGSRFAITSFDAEYEPSETFLKATGKLQDLFAILDAPPLRLMSAYGRDMSGLKGDVEATAELAFPLAKDLPIEQVRIASAGVVRNVSARLPDLEGELRAKALEVAATVDALTLEGTVVYQGLSLRATLREAFTAEGGESGLSVQARFDKDDLERMAGLGRFLTEGRVTVSVDMSLEDSEGPLALRLDVKDAGLTIPPMGWSKPRGASGVATAQLQAVRGGWRIAGIAADIADLSLRGEINLGDQGGLRALNFDRLRIGERTSMSVNVEARDEGGYLMRLQGESVDLVSRFAGNESEAVRPESEPTTPVEFRFDFGKVYITENGVVEAAQGQGERVSDGRIEAVVSARAGRAEVLGEFWLAENNGQGFRIFTDNAGVAFRDMNLSDNISGGRMALEGIARGDLITGELRARDIVIRDAPVLADLLASATVIGLFDQVGSGGHSFSRVSLPFRVTPEEVQVKDAAATGPSLGVSLEGRVDRVRQRLDMRGTLAPFNIIQAPIREVPIIGDLFGDAVAVSYTVKGPLGDPDVSVNPLTVLTPGIFRRLLSGDSFDVEREERGQGRQRRERSRWDD